MRTLRRVPRRLTCLLAVAAAAVVVSAALDVAPAAAHTEVAAGGVLGAPMPRGVGTAATAARWLTYGGVLLAAGGVAFSVFVHDGDAGERLALDRIVSVAAAGGALATVAGVPLQAVVASGLGVSAAADPGVLGAVMTSRFGVAAAVRVVALVALVVAAVSRARRGRSALALLAGLVALASFALAGHAATGEPRVLAVVGNYAHTVSGAVWFGGLVMFAVVLRRRRTADDAVGAAHLVARFSVLAAVSVAVLVAAGSALAWAEVRTLSALTSTTYGWTVLAKSAAVASILGVGAYNNRCLLPVLRRDQGAAWQTLRRTVTVEIVGTTAVLAATAVLVGLAPPRAEALSGIHGLLHGRYRLEAGQRDPVRPAWASAGRTEEPWCTGHRCRRAASRCSTR